MPASAPSPGRQAWPSSEAILHHPACLPPRVREIPRPFAPRLAAAERTFGALRFELARPPRSGALVEVSITVCGDVQRFRGTVHWVRPLGRRYEVALRLTDREHAYRARMIEQACQIEAYRQRESTRTGRALGLEQAAARWIERYARQFAELWERPVTGAKPSAPR